MVYVYCLIFFFFLLCSQQHEVDNVIELVKGICSVLCFVETRAITDAVEKLRAVPWVKRQVKDGSLCPIFLFKTGA